MGAEEDSPSTVEFEERRHPAPLAEHLAVRSSAPAEQVSGQCCRAGRSKQPRLESADYVEGWKDEELPRKGHLWFGRVNSNVVRLDPSRPLVQIAPMLHVMDRHFRMFVRQLTSRAQLWSEMVVDSTILHAADLESHLGFSPAEHPIVCQIGGNDPVKMAAACQIIQKWKYDAVNINVGCPSHRVVAKGCFGAILMKEPQLVADMAKSIIMATQDGSTTAASSFPLSIKTRIGFDGSVGGDWLERNIAVFGSSGCRDFVIHAREAKCGISPAKNRYIPPLNFDEVFDLERKFCHETKGYPGHGSDAVGAYCPGAGDGGPYRFSINGGVQNLDEVYALLHVPSYHNEERSALDGVMIGRAAADNPCMLADVDRRIYGHDRNPETAYNRRTVVEGYIDYLDNGTRMGGNQDEGIEHSFRYLRPVSGLFYSTPASKFCRQMIDKIARSDLEKPQVKLERFLNELENKFPELLAEPLTASE